MLDQILPLLKDAHPWRDHIHWLSVTDSTNTQAKLLAMEGAPHGTVLLADQQTAGRGRRGRSFHSPGGTGIYMSVILRPNCPPEKLMHLTCAAGVFLCNAIESAVGIRPGIKWANDLVVGQRKIAGILTELGFTSNGLVDYVVVGIGLNCCQAELDFPDDLRATADSLASVSGQDISREVVAAAMIDQLHRMDNLLFSHQISIMERYRRDCITLGKEVSVIRGDVIRHGLALDVCDDGALQVLYGDGQRETVNSGEVSVRGMYGYV